MTTTAQAKRIGGILKEAGINNHKTIKEWHTTQDVGIIIEYPDMETDASHQLYFNFRHNTLRTVSSDLSKITIPVFRKTAKSIAARLNTIGLYESTLPKSAVQRIAFMRECLETGNDETCDAWSKRLLPIWLDAVRNGNTPSDDDLAAIAVCMYRFGRFRDAVMLTPLCDAIHADDPEADGERLAFLLERDEQADQWTSDLINHCLTHRGAQCFRDSDGIRASVSLFEHMAGLVVDDDCIKANVLAAMAYLLIVQNHVMDAIRNVEQALALDGDCSLASVESMLLGYVRTNPSFGLTA